MKKQIKRILALALSLVMAFSCYCVIPAFAAGSTANCTIVQPEMDENGIVESGTKWAYKNSLLTVDSKYAGTTVQVDNIWDATITDLGENKLQGAGWRNETQTNYTVYSAQQIKAVTDGNILDSKGAGWIYDSTTSNNDAAQTTSWVPSTATDVTGVKRFETGNYDALIYADLGSTTVIDSIYAMQHYAYNYSWRTYKIYVSDSMDTLWDDESEVVLFDYYDGYGKNQAAFTLNGVSNVAGANVNNNRSEGQVWRFAGENKPVGRYVGYKIYQGAIQSTYMFLYELGATGTQDFSVIKPEIDASGNTQSGTTWQDKLQYLTVDSKYAGTVQVDNMAHIDAENQVKALQWKSATSGFLSPSEAQFIAATDGGILNSVGAGWTDGAAAWQAGTWDKSTATERGTARFETGAYDALVVADLGAITEIDSIYEFGHFNQKMVWRTYKIYVGNDMDSLWDAKNEVALFDYYEAYSKNDTKYSLNGKGSAGGSGVANSRSDGQLWSFNGEEKPVGRYVGFKVFETALSDTGNEKMIIYEIGATGTPVADGVDGFATVEGIDANQNGAAANVVYNGEALAATVTVTDANGEEADALYYGESYTLTADAGNDGFEFIGWYKGDQKVGDGLTYNVDSYTSGDAYVAKYNRDVIVTLNPQKASLKLNEIGVYDETEGALKFTFKAASGSCNISSWTQDGTNPQQTQYAPWTTYKVTYKVKFKSAVEGAKMTLGYQPSIVINGLARELATNDNYTTITYYFNSGAADWARDARVSSKTIGANTFNISGIDATEATEANPAYFYIKEFTIERADNVVVNAENATVTMQAANNFTWAPPSGEAWKEGTFGTSETGAAATVGEVRDYIKADMAKAGIAGAANGTVAFTVAAEDGYKVDTVTVNGEVVEAVDGVYTANYTAAANAYEGAEKPYASDAVVVNVTTVAVAQYTVEYYVDGELYNTQLVFEGANAIVPETPTKAGHTFSGWNNDGTNITADTRIDGTFTADTFTVTFKDWDGTVLSTQTVEYGAAAEAPADPTREGYTFTGWDVADFSNITGDLTITAQYDVNSHTVNFVFDGEDKGSATVTNGESAELPFIEEKAGHNIVWDYDGEAITEDTTIYGRYERKLYAVEFEFEGEVIDSITAYYGDSVTVPTVEAKEGYNVVWEYEGEAITEATTITGCYVKKTFEVTFVDWDGAVIDTKYVPYQESAEAPADPTREGYTFTGWDVAYNNITADTTVTATYTIKTFTVTFVGFEGAELGEQTVNYGESATAPTAPEVEGYTFAGWDGSYENVTADTTVTAKYEVIMVPVHFKDASGIIETVEVEYGAAVSDTKILEIEAQIEDVYGYTVMKDEETGRVIWNDNAGQVVTAEITFEVRYQLIGLQTVVTVYGLDDKEIWSDTMAYDQAIELGGVEGANSWTDAKGNVLLAAATGTLYAVGGNMDIFASASTDSPAVAIVGKAVENNTKFSAFAHINNAAGVVEYGIIFASGSYVEANGESIIDLNNVAANPTKLRVTSTTATGRTDFMATLVQSKINGNYPKYARAYVKYSDGSVEYSNVVVSQ